jgi:hypothetical protein
MKMATKPASNRSSSSSSTSFKSKTARGVSSAASTATATATLGGGREGREFVQLNAVGLKWTDDGKRLLVLGKDRFCSCDISFKEDDGAVDITVDEDGD